ncbi:fluoride efflux transporter FluC [Tessaracoccus lapidicaptus]|uniref:fluoride efflux transporter FluC n=1 Tax=Tessaracoccus lapidicaptus TaxID=1427523 RepID=UPI003342A91F
MALNGRPAHLDPRRVALVAAGGTIGAGLRSAIGSVTGGSPLGIPWPTLAINVAGALALGLLVEVLAATVREPRRRQSLQLALGTGLLGGFTTYSAFAVETATLAAHRPALAVGYAGGSLVLGYLAAAAGMWLGRRVPGGRP